MLADLKKFVDKYNDTVEGGCCCFKQVDHNYYVAVCTPLMARVYDSAPDSGNVAC